MGTGSVISKGGVIGTGDATLVAQLGGLYSEAGSGTSQAECLACNEFWIRCSVGTLSVDVSIDGVNWDNVAVCDGVATNQGTWLLTLAANKLATLPGRFRGVRIKQSGGVASNGYLQGNPAS